MTRTEEGVIKRAVADRKDGSPGYSEAEQELRYYIARNAGKTFTKEEMQDALTGTEITEETLERLLEKYQESGNLRKSRRTNTYTIRSMWFYNAVTKWNDDTNFSARILARRVQRMTLEQISKEEKVSRELIRLKEKEELREVFSYAGQKSAESHAKNYVFKDEALFPLVVNTKHEDHFIQKVAKTHPEILGTLYLANRRKRDWKLRGAKTPLTYTKFKKWKDAMPEWFTTAVFNYYFKKGIAATAHTATILDDGTEFSAYTAKTFAEILRLHGEFTVKELLEIYEDKKYLMKIPEKNPSWDKNEKTKKRYIREVILLHPNILRCKKKTKTACRYYDYEKYREQIPVTLRGLRLPHDEGVYDADTIYRYNQKELKAIDIHNGTELHHIMRKWKRNLPKRVELMRTPELRILSKDMKNLFTTAGK